MAGETDHCFILNEDYFPSKLPIIGPNPDMILPTLQ
jgi:hypothetical protein